MGSKLFSHLSAKGTRLEDFDFRSEAVLQGYIEENPDILAFRQEDSEDITILGLEEQWAREDGKGRIDLLVLYSDDTYGVVELKNGTLKIEHFEQLIGYLSNKDFLRKAADKLSVSPDYVKWEGVLIGSDVGVDLLNVVSEYNKNHKDVPVSVLTIKRYKSGGQLFSKVDSYPYTRNNRDNSEYFFHDTWCKKAQLVYEMVKEYVKNNAVLFSDLSSKLNPLVQKSNPIVISLSDALEGSDNYSVDSEKILSLQDDQIVVRRWWLSIHEPIFEKVALALGYTDFSIKNKRQPPSS